MKVPFTAAVFAASILFGGCAMQDQRASAAAVGPHDEPNVNSKDGQRREFMVGSRIPRETRESAESVKSVSRRAYEEGKGSKPGSSLDGGG